MATDVAVLIARLEADVRKFDKGMKTAEKRLKKVETQTNKTTKATKKMEKGMSNMGGVMKKVFAGAAAIAVFKFFKGAIQRAEALNSAYAITEQVIKQTGGAANVTAQQIKELSEEQAKLTGIDKELVTQSNNVLLTFKNVSNQVGAGNDIFAQASGLILDMATVMGTDAKSGAIQLGKALNDPILGVSALNRVGIQFTDTQKEQIKNFQDSGDLMSAQKIILKELEDQLGGTAVAAADSTAKIGNAFKDVSEAVGGVFLEVIEDLEPELIELAETLEELAPALGAVAEAVFEIVSSSLPLIEGLAELIIQFDKLKRGTKDLGIELQKSEDSADNFFGVFLEAFSGNFFQNIIQAAKLLAGGPGGLREVTEELEDASFDAAEALRFEGLAAKAAGEAAVIGAGGQEELEEELTAVEKAAKNAKKEVDKYLTTLQDLVDAPLAAANSLIALQEAHIKVDELQAAGKEGTDEFALAQLELAAQVFETQAKLDALDAAGVTRAIGAIAAALDISSEAARQLLTDLGLLDGLEVTAVFTLTGGGAAAIIRATDAAAASAPRNITMHQGGIVPGPVGASVPIVAQAGERIIPTSQASQGAGGGDVNITIEGDLTEPVFEDLQRELILDSIGRFVETR